MAAAPPGLSVTQLELPSLRTEMKTSWLPSYTGAVGLECRIVLAFGVSFVQAGENSALTSASRYAVQRLGEALDPGSHFTRSALFSTPPLTLLRELRDLAAGFAASQPHSYRLEVQRATGYTRSAMRLDRQLHRSHPALYAALVAASRDVVNQPDDASARASVTTLLLPALASLIAAMEASPTYHERLAAQVLSKFVAPPTTLREWSSFDWDLVKLAAVALDEGRDGPTVASQIAEQMRDCESDAEAQAGLRSAVSSAPRAHSVALVLEGVSSFSNGPAPDVVTVTRSAGWPDGGMPTSADESLRAFAARHLDRGRCVVTVEVRAYDPGQAQIGAAARLRPLSDQISALHRGIAVTILPQALVLDRITGVTTLREPRREPVTRAALMRAPADGVLAEAMHYHALACHESVSAVGVLHAFIALERLALGAEVTRGHVPTGTPRRAPSFLPPHVQAAVVLCSIQHLLIESWRHLCVVAHSSDALAQGCSWGQQADEALDLVRWGEMLTQLSSEGPQRDRLRRGDSPADAARTIRSALETCTPYARVRFQLDARQWSQRNHVLQRADENGSRAFAHCDRLRLMRNRTVHQAVTGPAGADQLAAVGRGLVETVLEVIPSWVSTTQPIWMSLHDLAKAKQDRMTQWRANPISANRIVDP